MRTAATTGRFGSLLSNCTQFGRIDQTGDVESVAEAVAGVSFVVLIASCLLAVGRFLARPGNGRFGNQTPGEVKRFNPEAGFYMALSVRLNLFVRLAMGSATVLAFAVAATALL